MGLIGSKKIYTTASHHEKKIKTEHNSFAATVK
jgi:hypothetical protein